MQRGSLLIYRLRLLAGLLLLAAAGYSVWQTIEILSARRALRMDLAELSHVRYGLLNADRWVEKIVPVLDAQIDALDLAASNGVSLRPTVVQALNRLLDQVTAQMTPAPPADGKPAGFAAVAQAMIVKNMVAGLKPHIPEYADMVLRELGKPDSKKAIRDYIRGAVADGAKTTFGAVDMGPFNAILKQYGCADGVACRSELARRIGELDSAVTIQYLVALIATVLAFLLLDSSRWAIAVQLLFCIALLLGGVLSPMIEVEARISKLSLTFFATPISFPEQLLYYQSKSVLEVFRTLITMGQPEMVVVAVLILMFSVVFPALKVIAVGLVLNDPSLPQRNRLARFFALESSKWSMADVMALSIFMSFVAFNGLIGNAMGLLKGAGAQLVIPTDSSKILPGYYLFVGFCVASLWLAKKLERHVRAQ
jgi:hypothetical protein